MLPTFSQLEMDRDSLKVSRFHPLRFSSSLFHNFGDLGEKCIVRGRHSELRTVNPPT